NSTFVTANEKMSEAVNHALECGRLLHEAKAFCNGNWGEWQKANLTFKQETASLYMRFHDHREFVSNAVTNSDEPLTLRGVVALLPKGKPRGKAGGRAKEPATAPAPAGTPANPIRNPITPEQQAAVDAHVQDALNGHDEMLLEQGKKIVDQVRQVQT